MDGEEQGTALVKARPQAVAKVTPMTIAETKAQIRLLQEMVHEVMVRGRDYGRTPGIPQDSLWDPGASLIINHFHAYPGHRRIIHLHEGEDRISVCIEVPIISYSGQEIGTGIGAASTFETKHKYRWVEVPQEWGYNDEGLALLKVRKDRGKVEYRIPNPEAGELLNTLMKMACLGSTVTVLFRGSKSIIRSNVSKMFQHLQKGPVWLPTPNGCWVRVTAMVRKHAPVLRIKLGDNSVIRATAEHRLPTAQCVKTVSEIEVGDVLLRSDILPQGTGLTDAKYGWLIGLFIADGSYGDHGASIRFTLNKKEREYAARIADIVSPLGCRVSISERSGENAIAVNVFGQAASGLMKQFVEGSDCYTKHFSRFVWNQPREFLRDLLEGYLRGDSYLCKRKGHRQKWSIAFTGRNRELAEDLRTLCDILGLRISLKRRSWTGFGKTCSVFHGWVKQHETNYKRDTLEKVIGLKREPKRAVVYDIEIDHPDGIFLLANGIHSHNSKRAEVDAAESLPGVASALRELFHEAKKGESRDAEGASWQRFWGDVARLGLTSDQAREMLGVSSLKSWLASGKSLDSAIAELSSMLRQNEGQGEKGQTAEAPVPDRSQIRSVNDLFRACHEDFGMQPDEVVREAGYSSKTDISDPASAYAQIAAVRRGAK